ncbi:hypothetical protein [Kitasatospora sp. A2-31]|uniref:hypothetical protein n=1 Tax=Kitasatospora sp. A2-31 TaxID=2916414 RepID=UPI0035ABA1C5
MKKLVHRALAAGAALSACVAMTAGAGTAASAAPATPAAAPAAVAAPVPLTGSQLAASWTAPLSTRGRYIVDANNQAGQVSHNLPLGLDRAPIADILTGFHRLGINSVRLPFANAMIHDTAPVPDVAVTANPQLKGKTNDTYAVGYSVRSNAMSALLCAPAAAALPQSGRNVWFDHGDNRPATGGSTGSDWAPGYYKGQCTDDEYVAGVAFTWKWLHYGVPDALLCHPVK